MPRMDERVFVQRVTETRDDLGGVTRTWEDIICVWADVFPGRGREAFEAMRVAGATQYNVIMRWREDANGQPYVTNLDRVKWRGRYYGIDAVMPYGGRKAYMKLAVTEGKAS